MLKAAATAADVENAKNKLTGRNGSLTALSPMMGKIAKEDKPTAGKAFNEAKNAVQAMIEEARERLGGGKVSTEAIDVTLPDANGRSGASIRSTRPLTNAVRFSAEWDSR